MTEIPKTKIRGQSFFTDHIKFHEFQGKIQLTFCVLNSENEKEEGFFLCKTKGQYLNTSI